jgi:tetratricopeptide (TPR) repeat protein
MPKLFFVLIILLNISALYGKGTAIKVLLLNNTWLKADLLKSDRKGNLTIQLDKRERILRRKEFRLVKMTLPPEMLKAGELLKLNKTREAGKLLDSVVEKYNFPLMQLKIKILQAQIKIADDDYQTAVSLLSHLLEEKIVMPQLEASSYAHGFLLLGNAYAQLKQQDNAAKAYRRSFDLAVPEYSATANLNLGKMLLKQKITQGALDCFLENISVFAPEVPGRKLSLQATISIYKKNKDKKLKVYEDMLKKEYSIK